MQSVPRRDHHAIVQDRANPLRVDSKGEETYRIRRRRTHRRTPPWHQHLLQAQSAVRKARRLSSLTRHLALRIAELERAVQERRRIADRHELTDPEREFLLLDSKIQQLREVLHRARIAAIRARANAYRAELSARKAISGQFDLAA